MTISRREWVVGAAVCAASVVTSCKFFGASREPQARSGGSVMAGLEGFGEDGQERTRVEMEYRLTCAEPDGKLRSVNSRKTRGESGDALVEFEGLKAASVKECWLDAFGPKEKANRMRVAECPTFEGNEAMYHYYASSKASFTPGGNTLSLTIYSLCRRLVGANDVPLQVRVTLKPGGQRPGWGEFESASATMTCDKGTYTVVAPIPATREATLPFVFAVPRDVFDGQSCRAVSVQLKRAGGASEVYDVVGWSAQLHPPVMASGQLPPAEAVARQVTPPANQFCVRLNGATCSDRLEATVRPSAPWVAVVEGWPDGGAIIGPPVAMVASAKFVVGTGWRNTAAPKITIDMLEADMARVFSGTPSEFSWYMLTPDTNRWLESAAGEPTAQIEDAVLTRGVLTDDATRVGPMRHPHHLAKVFVFDTSLRWVESR